MSASMFPCISRSYIEHCQFSSWYGTFSRVSPQAMVIRPLSADFREYLEADGVMVPEGSEDFPVTSTLSDESESEDEAQGDPPSKRLAFPELDAQIRDVISRYEAVFPKLNWTSPKDASWILPTLKCTSPADVYLLLKSSDFISHDLDPSLAFEGCTPCSPEPALSSAADKRALGGHELELVLKKWYLMDHGHILALTRLHTSILSTILGIAQRDPNYYPHLNEQATKTKIACAVSDFWTRNIKMRFGGGGDYVFDVYLTRDLSSAHLLDINPYHPKTDPILFTYEELLHLLISSSGMQETASSLAPGPLIVPELRLITSPSDLLAMRNAPVNQHNAIPFDALQMSHGVDINTFSSHWLDEIKQNLASSPETGPSRDE